MKISAFAQKFNTTKTTIRYYTKINLLIPNLEGTYPEYDDRCQRDMADILFYQSKGFSNTEILKIKSLQRFSVNDPETYTLGIKQIIDVKISSYLEEISTLKTHMSDLADFRTTLDVSRTKRSMGFPLAGLDNLMCPCGGDFIISQTTIIKGQISKGLITCTCGQSYKIEEGIVMDTKDALKHFKPMEIHGGFQYVDNNNIATFNEISIELKAYMSTIDHSQGVLFTGPGPELFLMNPEAYFKEDGNYIFLLQDHVTAFVIKSILQNNDLAGSFMLFMLDEPLPLGKGPRHLVDLNSFLLDHRRGHEMGTYLGSHLKEPVQSFFGLYTIQSPANHWALDAKKIDDIFASLPFQDQIKKSTVPIKHDEDIFRRFGCSDNLAYQIRRSGK